jgi:molybdate/tungstate transport system substrate-binding protein
MKHLIFCVSVFSVLFTACRSKPVKNQKEIIVFNAGSLSVPLKKLADEYEKLNPGTKILMEPAGSLVCARKITELKKPCDIIASADYFVIDKLIVPEYASWSIRFATNEIVIAFQEKSKYASEIDSSNWMDILLRDDVTYARSDPDADPCGYRSVFAFKLAEKYYGIQGLEDRLLSKNKDFIRPKEVDLVALVEANAVDYMFQYKSVAIQHGLKFIELPDYINLGDPSRNELYHSVSLEVTGSAPGSKLKINGDYINYSLSVLTGSVNKENAVDFVAFLLSREGLDIFKKNGQDPIIPFITDQPEMLPERLRKYLEPGNSVRSYDKK